MLFQQPKFRDWSRLRRCCFQSTTTEKSVVTWWKIPRQVSVPWPTLVMKSTHAFLCSLKNGFGISHWWRSATRLPWHCSPWLKQIGCSMILPPFFWTPRHLQQRAPLQHLIRSWSYPQRQLHWLFRFATVRYFEKIQKNIFPKWLWRMVMNPMVD